MKRDEAHRCGIRKGDVVTHINGIPVVTHTQAIKIVNSSTSACENIEIVLLCKEHGHGEGKGAKRRTGYSQLEEEC
jgi:S1-C subfamily serine protease